MDSIYPQPANSSAPLPHPDNSGNLPHVSAPDGTVPKNSEYDGSVRQSSELGGSVRQDSENFGTIRNHSEFNGSVPKPSEPGGSVRQNSQDFGLAPNYSELDGTLPQKEEEFTHPLPASIRRENHTMSVREVARLFEEAGVARSERSVVNWCQPNRHGVARLDCFYDPNERRYFITRQSVEVAIQEEQAKSVREGVLPAPASSTFASSTERPTDSADEPRRQASSHSFSADEAADRQQLEAKLRDLEITNRAKDFFIEQLQGERERFHQELMKSSRQVGQLETQLLQLEGPPRFTEQGKETGGMGPEPKRNQVSWPEGSEA